ncbi:hypothetical protein M0802_011842 [Mischocyttarus mexicanus]|nr:hypothetical protein M0802_011842 [Mischocyttarus mexicanus]
MPPPLGETVYDDNDGDGDVTSSVKRSRDMVQELGRNYVDLESRLFELRSTVSYETYTSIFHPLERALPFALPLYHHRELPTNQALKITKPFIKRLLPTYQVWILWCTTKLLALMFISNHERWYGQDRRACLSHLFNAQNRLTLEKENEEKKGGGDGGGSGEEVTRVGCWCPSGRGSAGEAVGVVGP